MTAHYAKIYGGSKRLWCSSEDGATGVKQLSALAALGETRLLNQEGLSKSPSLQGNSKPRGRRSPWAAMGAICFVVMVQQVSPARRKISPQAQYQECPPHTVTHSAHTSQQPMFTLIPPHAHTTVCFELCKRSPPVQKKMLNKRAGEKKWKEQPWPPLVLCSMLVFVWMSQGWVFFPPPSISQGRHQSCTCASSASGLVAAL